MNGNTDQQLFESAFKYAAIGMALVGLDGKFLKANHSLCKILKYTESELTQLTFQDITHPDDLDRDLNALNKLNCMEIDSYKMEKRYFAKDGTEIWAQLSVSLIKNEDGTPKHYISQIQDITALKKANKKLVITAHTDALTGIANRHTFQAKLEEMIQACERNETEFSLLYIDFDNFKRINDTYGHLFGDDFLQVISKKIKSLLTEDQFIARLSGDEFVIILKHNIKEENEAKHLAIRILQAFHHPLSFSNQQIQASASIGIATYPEHGKNLETLMRHADYALYELKHRGGNNFMFFNNHLAEEYQRGIYIEQALIEAIKNNLIHIHYQPILHLETLDISYYEALARWHDRKLGDIQPEEFIHHAEKTGAIKPLGKMLMEQIFTDINQIKDASFRVGINLSPLQLIDQSFATQLKTLMTSYSISKHDILMEFVETSLISENSHATYTMHKLSEMGIATTIDDFGTGYASLNYIRQFNIDSVKIDKAYVGDIENNFNSYEIVKAIITLGKTLKIKVIAEGIENQQQLAILKELGCEYGQGFFFAKPAPITDLELPLCKDTS